MLEGAIQIIGSSLLGLTLQCAKCHDHKFEPVTQKDYYQLQAILYPAFNVEHWVKPNDRVVIAGPAPRVVAPWEAHEKAIDAEIDAQERMLVPRPKDAAQGERGQAEGARRGHQGGEREALPNPGRIAWVGDGAENPSDALLLPGQPGHAGPGRGPGRAGVLDRPGQSIRARSRQFPGLSSTGRRLALARWLTRPGSRPAALLARVLANRIWQHHFGTGLAATSDNLGYTGRPADPSRAARIPGRRAGPIGLERQGLASPDPELVGLSAVERPSARGSSRSIPTTACWRGFRSAGSTPRRSATPCSPPRASSMTAREGRTSDPSHRLG